MPDVSDMSDVPLPPPVTVDRRRLKRVGIGVGIAALVVVAVGVGSRIQSDHRLASVAADNAVPSVSLIAVKTAAGGGALVLPGNVQAYNSAPLYARTNGYVRRWLVDIGDQVRAGQTMAIIDAPDLDQQLAQARADYQTALANQQLAKTTATRWDALLAKDAVSRQEADEKRGDLAAKSALANAARANVARLTALQGFTRIEAPFAGVVTSRAAQIGALIVAGNAASTPLFTVSDVHRMRIYVRVPQSYSARIHPGMHAVLTVPEYPGRGFDTVLARSADAVDAASGTMLVELQADNGDRALKPGAYAQVKFPLAAAAGAVRIPASALIVRDDGTSVALVDPAGRVVIRPVKVARDDGSTVEIGSGLNGGERIIDMPPDAIAPGDRVRVAKAGAGAGDEGAGTHG